MKREREARGKSLDDISLCDWWVVVSLIGKGDIEGRVSAFYQVYSA